MSAITVENDLVHYEVLGRGRPVIFVHGWLGSWRYWVPTMQQLSVKYRTYALDLWGFGDSGKDANHYTFKDQVVLLHDFMEKLGITKAALVGHSLGAAICLRFATQYPDRAPRVALINPPLYDLGGLDDAPISMPVAKPAPAVAAPVATPAPAPVIAGSNPAPAAPSATPAVVPPATGPAPVPSSNATPAAHPTGSTPASPTPGMASAATPTATNATGAVPVPPAVPGTTPTAPANPTPAAATPAPNAAPGTPSGATPAPAANAVSGSPASSAATPAPSTPPAAPSNTDTIPRNPFRTPGETPEEILARLQAKNVASSAGLGAPAPSTQSPQPVPKPATPSTPALPTGIGTPILPKTSTLPAIPAPARTDLPNPLLKILTGKPGDLLTRYIDPHAPDLDKLRVEVEKADEAAIAKSAQSFTGVNLAVELQRLPTPTLLLHGKDDPLFPAPSDELLIRIDKGKPAGHLLALVEPGLHHFPMLEITAKFNRLLLDFLDAQDLNNVQFKDQWRRTMR